MVDNCKHVKCIKPGLELGILNPERWQCLNCGTTESVWACLACSNVACGRYIEEHAIHHFHETGHPLCIEVNEKFVFCYECDDFILNDNAPGDIKLLRMALDAVAAQNFDDLNAIEGGRRILRSHMTETANKSHRLMKADHVHTALVKHRVSLLSWVTRQWYTALVNKRQAAGVTTVCSTGTESRKKRNINFQPGITGLRNLGNTCYMNSVLQILSHAAAFSNFIVGHNPSEVIPQSRKYPFVHQTTLECFEVVDSPSKKAAVLLGSERLAQASFADAALPPGDVSNNEGRTYSPSTTSSSSGGLNGGSSNIQATETLTYADKPAHSLYEELHALFRVLWSGKRAVVSPHSLLYAIWQAVPAFKGYKQQDAQEFLGMLLDKLQSELHAPREWTPDKHDFITRAFQGRLESRVTCANCGHVTHTEDPFLDLSLAFTAPCQTGESESCDILEMIDLFVNETAIDGKAYACKACNRRRRGNSNGPPSRTSLPSRRRSSGLSSMDACESPEAGLSGVDTSPSNSGAERDGSVEESRRTLYTAATQTIRISRLSKVLRLHLKRFKWIGRQREKLCSHVSFPESLDLSHVCTEEALKGSSARYQLTGVVVHHGRGFMSGHYTAYCLNDKPETWIHCNDTNVTPCCFDEVGGSQAYILFYSQLVPSGETSSGTTTPINSVGKGGKRRSRVEQLSGRRRQTASPSSEKRRKVV